jgi:hypothetical protein
MYSGCLSAYPHTANPLHCLLCIQDVYLSADTLTNYMVLTQPYSADIQIASDGATTGPVTFTDRSTAVGGNSDGEGSQLGSEDGDEGDDDV